MRYWVGQVLRVSVLCGAGIVWGRYCVGDYGQVVFGTRQALLPKSEGLPGVNVAAFVSNSCSNGFLAVRAVRRYGLLMMHHDFVFNGPLFLLENLNWLMLNGICGLLSHIHRLQRLHKLALVHRLPILTLLHELPLLHKLPLRHGLHRLNLLHGLLLIVHLALRHCLRVLEIRLHE